MGLPCFMYPNNKPCPGAGLIVSPQYIRVLITRKKRRMAIRRTTVIGCVPPEADHEIRLQGKGLVYLEGDPRKHWQEMGKQEKGEEVTNEVYINEKFIAIGN